MYAMPVPAFQAAGIIDGFMLPSMRMTPIATYLYLQEKE
jgi:hypothetical protein